MDDQPNITKKNSRLQREVFVRPGREINVVTQADQRI